jgi:hypothetical protein
MKKIQSILCCMSLVALVSCRQERKTSCPNPAPLVDSAGAASEKIRVGLQWAAIQHPAEPRILDKDGISDRRAAEIQMERTVARYRDSMRVVDGALSSPAGCVDWRASLVDGVLDRQALATALVRSLVNPAATVMEWTVLDTAFDPARLRTVYSVSGKDGGAVDSASLDLGRHEVRRVK